MSQSPKQLNYTYNIIKGRIAETLVQELFLSQGYNVFRYGMENTVPGIMELLKGVRDDVATQIRRMPDFVVQHRDGRQVHFIEVKFRASGNFSLTDVPKNYPYENAYFIVISKRHIKVISYYDLLSGHAITPTCKNYLGSHPDFDLDKETIIEYCNFAVQFFATVE